MLTPTPGLLRTGHLPTPGPFPSFHTHAASSQNKTTQQVLMKKKSRLAHLSSIEEGCKGMFPILYMHFFIAYQARITSRNWSYRC